MSSMTVTSKRGSTVALRGWKSEEEEPPLPLVPSSRWSTACPACAASGKGNPARGTSLLLWKRPKQHANRAILSFPYAYLCRRAHGMDTWPLYPSRGCLLQAWPNKEDFYAQFSKRSFLHAPSLKCKAVDWLLLNTRKSRMCQSWAAGGREP